MKTIDEVSKEYAENKSSSDVFKESHKKDFKAGVEFAQRWIDANIELPEKDELVLIKLTKAAWTLNKYSVAYLDSSYQNKNVWILENRHCTHHAQAVNNIITHWRPIEIK